VDHGLANSKANGERDMEKRRPSIMGNSESVLVVQEADPKMK
jgi:hypothetical protein